MILKRSEVSISGRKDFVFLPLKYITNPVEMAIIAAIAIIIPAITPPLNPLDLLDLKCLTVFDSAFGFELEESGELEEDKLEEDKLEEDKLEEGVKEIFELDELDMIILEELTLITQAKYFLLT